jgi:uncharacterized protein YxeA
MSVTKEREVNKMKKVLTIFLTVVFVLICGLFYDKEVNHYEMNGVVYADEGDVLVLLDTTDNLWEIDYTDTLKVGDEIKITFYTNGTDAERVDDEITAIVKK